MRPRTSSSFLQSATFRYEYDLVQRDAEDQSACASLCARVCVLARACMHTRARAHTPRHLPAHRMRGSHAHGAPERSRKNPLAGGGANSLVALQGTNTYSLYLLYLTIALTSLNLTLSRLAGHQDGLGARLARATGPPRQAHQHPVRPRGGLRRAPLGGGGWTMVCFGRRGQGRCDK